MAIGGSFSVALLLASRRTAINRHPTLLEPGLSSIGAVCAHSDCLANSRADFITRCLLNLNFPRRNIFDAALNQKRTVKYQSKAFY